jgi:transposase
MRRYELTDEQWEKIRDLFPSNEGRRGTPWNDHRQTLNGMFWILCSGAPWRDLPERYGKWGSVYDRFRRYRTEGMFDRILARLQLELNEEGLIDYHLWEVDSTTVRAHKSAAGASALGAKKGIVSSPENRLIMH